MMRVRDIAVCVVIGLAVTVGIAWCAAAFERQPSRRAMTTTLGPARESPRPPARFGFGGKYDASRNRVTNSGWAVGVEMVFLTPRIELGRDLGFAGMPAIINYEIYTAGWPLPALEWSDTNMRGTQSRARNSPLTRVWEFGLNYDGERHPLDGGWRSLPVRPWRYGLGLAVDTLAWAAAAWGILALCGVGRRGRRRRRGLCVACGYPLRDASGLSLQQCPECRVAAMRPSATAERPT